VRQRRASFSQSAAGKAVNTKALLAVLFGTAFVAAFNENIVNVGLMNIMAEFSVDSLTAQWLVTGYMMVTAVVTTLVAFLLRRFTLPQVFFGGSIVLVAGAIVDVLAPNFAVLLVARLAQAIGTGIFIPTMMSTVFAVAPRKRLGTHLSIGSCCITFGPAFGPVVSGLMVTCFGWRAMFAPTIAAVLLLMAAGIAVAALFALRQRRLDNPYLNLRPLRTPWLLACLRAGHFLDDDHLLHEHAVAAVLRGRSGHDGADGRRHGAHSHLGERGHGTHGRAHDGQAGRVAAAAARFPAHRCGHGVRGGNRRRVRRLRPRRPRPS
jgi:MFS family permease